MIFGRSAMESRSINVFSSRVPAGRIERNVQEEESLLFAYRERCEPCDAVSLTMPVRGVPYDAASGLHPIFEMNLPEGAARERLRLRFAKVIPGFDDLDILRIVGASQIGRLRYSTDEAIREDVPELDLGLILTYRGTADLFANLVEQYAQHSGISGGGSVAPGCTLRPRE
jgi:serine/threonine-protein kinase HipA